MKVVFYALCLPSPWNKLHSVNDANFAYGYIGKDSARKAELFFFFEWSLVYDHGCLFSGAS